MLLNLLKVHGSGNTFYLLETTDESSYDWHQLGKWLCEDEQHGGADGLLLVAPSKHAVAKMRVINADGSEASMCGNGLRCVARYVLEKENVEEAVIETMKADLHVQKLDAFFEDLTAYGVEIAPVSFDLPTLPLNYNAQQTLIDEVVPNFAEDIRFTAVSVPNPHLIGIVSKEYITNTEHQQRLASMLNSTNDYTPDGVNVSYVYPISQNEIYVRTFERGVGFTNACGTAMTASALVSKMLHLVDEDVITVYNPGGFVKVDVKKDGVQNQLQLIGNGTYMATYTLTNDYGNWQLTKNKDLLEQEKYKQLITFTKEKLSPVMA